MIDINIYLGKDFQKRGDNNLLKLAAKNSVNIKVMNPVRFAARRLQITISQIKADLYFFNPNIRGTEVIKKYDSIYCHDIPAEFNE